MKINRERTNSIVFISTNHIHLTNMDFESMQLLKKNNYKVKKPIYLICYLSDYYFQRLLAGKGVYVCTPYSNKFKTYNTIQLKIINYFKYMHNKTFNENVLNKTAIQINICTKDHLSRRTTCADEMINVYNNSCNMKKIFNNLGYDNKILKALYIIYNENA